MGSSALPLILCEYFIIFYSIFSFFVINRIQLKIKEWLCVGGSKNPQSCCLSYYLLFRFNVMICYVWIRYRVSENMHLSAACERWRLCGHVLLLFMMWYSSYFQQFSSIRCICVNMSLVLYDTVSLNSLSIRDSESLRSLSVTFHSFCPSY